MSRWKWIAVCVVLVLPLWGSTPQAQDTRQFYLSPIDGSADTELGWHSRCLHMPGAGNIDLRPWGVDAFLCASNDLPADMTGVEQIGASFRSALGGRKGSLNAKFKKTLQANTVEDLIVEVISPRLRAGKDGKLKIYLGGQIPVYQQTAWVPFRDGGLVADLSNAAIEAMEPAIAWATSASETFNCSDSASLTCVLTWTEFSGTTWGISSNAAQSNSLTAAEARADSAVSTEDHSVQSTLGSATESGTGFARCGVIARKANSATRTYYTLFADLDATNWETGKRVGGTYTSLATTTQDPAAADVMKLVPDGSSITGMVNGVTVLGPTTDIEITGNTYGGLYSHGNGTTLLCIQDSWSIVDNTSRSRTGALWFN